MTNEWQPIEGKDLVVETDEIVEPKTYIEVNRLCTGITIMDVPEQFYGWKIIIDALFTGSYISGPELKIRDLEFALHTFRLEQP
jgi:hypothetical protein